MRNEKIIQAIAAYLGKVMTYNNSLTKIQFERTCVNGAAEFIEQEATYIAAAIAPHLEAGAGEPGSGGTAFLKYHVLGIFC